MAFSDLTRHAASDAGVSQISPFVKGISLFAHNFSPDPASQFAGVQVPVYNLTAKTPSTSKDSWYNLDEIDGVVVPLKGHAIAGISLNDTGVATSEGGWGETSFTVQKIVSDATVAVLKAIETSIATDVYGMFTSANAKRSITLGANATLKDFSALVADAAKDLNPAETVLVLNTDTFYKLYAVLPANVIYTQADPIQDGVLRNVLGLKAVVLGAKLPTNVKGGFVTDGALGIVNRLNVPAINGYFDKFEVKTTDGFSVGFRAYEDLRDGALKFGGDCLYGAEWLQKDETYKANGFILVS